MEITGKIIQVFPPVSGTSKAGNAWKKREYVLETQETYPKKVFFDFFGDRADQYPLEGGQTIKLSFDIESREYNGRWYTSIRGWKAEHLDGAAATTPETTADFGGFPGDFPPAPVDAPQSGADDLPF